MKKVSLEELEQMASNAREAIWAEAKELGREPKIYMHWTAGRYYSMFDDYHINITGDGCIHVSTDDFSEILSHTYKRNTGSIGIAPTSAQIEALAQTVNAVANGLWLTIDKAHVMTHGEAADNEDGEYCHEPYGPKNGCERWDLEYLGTNESSKYNPWATDGSRGGDVLRGKANWYRNQAKKEE